MAHITQRRGRYVVRWRTADGSERSRSFERRRDAAAFRGTIEATKHAGGVIDPRAGRILFATVAQRWATDRIGIRASTAAANESYVRSMILPTFGGFPVAGIEPAAVRGWVAGLERAGTAPATIRKAFGILRAIFAQAITDRIISTNPAAGVRLPPLPTRRMEVLEAGEVLDLAAAADVFYRTHLLVAAATGLRWGEIAGLQIEHVDLLRGELRIVSQLAEVAGRLTLGAPLKTGTSARTVTVPRTVAEDLGEHLGRWPNDAGVAFTTLSGRLMRRSNFGRSVLKPAARQIGRPAFRFHDLRHTHATLLLAAGEPITNVSARLGHRDPSVTLRIYGHVLEGSDRAAADRFDSILSATAGNPRDGGSFGGSVHRLGGE